MSIFFARYNIDIISKIIKHAILKSDFHLRFLNSLFKNFECLKTDLKTMPISIKVNVDDTACPLKVSSISNLLLSIFYSENQKTVELEDDFYTKVMTMNSPIVQS